MGEAKKNPTSQGKNKKKLVKSGGRKIEKEIIRNFYNNAVVSL